MSADEAMVPWNCAMPARTDEPRSFSAATISHCVVELSGGQHRIAVSVSPETRFVLITRKQNATLVTIQDVLLWQTRPSL
ncbi:hypothetical protein RM533_07095 [Croceicoccus sp. F390]|uniref:Uncharacterized protein n=1 Tax=Croceicoccus esteveae TaxID=3075597 RepID=A0ABU2ZH68_9SPHN|nr:hypothetical protein [Croceicoccus sp. F390]MDT0575949.1 hypothetical protein [Croceicoccus sp. F390]